jgi:hypothetical protein
MLAPRHGHAAAHQVVILAGKSSNATSAMNHARTSGLLVPDAVLIFLGMPFQTDGEQAGKLAQERDAVMTESEWLACTDPQPMLALVHGKRKLRLFAVGCCRRLFPMFSALQVDEVVEAADQYTDGCIGRRRLRAIWNDIFCQTMPYRYFSPEWHARRAVVNLILGYCLKHRPRPMAMNDVTSAIVKGRARWWHPLRRRKIRTEERSARAHLLRDIFGNPFRPSAFDPSWRTPQVVALGQEIYDNRAFDCLPELADALAKAGCENADILAHCRGPGPHVRGCWVTDLILGKE